MNRPWTPVPGVLIDASVPRNDEDRCTILFEYLIDISAVGPHQGLDPEYNKPEIQTLDEEDISNAWYDLEESILSQINIKLPDWLICTVGEFQPGDVVVREIGLDDGF